MSARRGSGSWLMSITRIWLPLAIAVVGVVLIAIGGTTPALVVQNGGSALSAIGVCLLLVALIVWMINWLFRMSLESNRDREREEEARRYFDEHGRWPDDP
jgi:protein-S-isoprenylcysteine O-methyltransferase Ste14